jgi:hypothetical protein
VGDARGDGRLPIELEAQGRIFLTRSKMGSIRKNVHRFSGTEY